MTELEMFEKIVSKIPKHNFESIIVNIKTGEEYKFTDIIKIIEGKLNDNKIAK